MTLRDSLIERGHGRGGAYLLDVAAYALEVGIERGLVLAVDDFEQRFEFVANVSHLAARAWIEEYFAQQAVVLAQHAFGYLHVALEGGAGGVLMLHDGGEDEGADKRDAQRVGHRFVVLVEGVLAHVQPEA